MFRLFSYTVCIGILIFPFFAYSQILPNQYRVEIKDKKYNSYSVSLPEEFLSAEAIQRRTKYSIPVTEQDLPISDIYLDSIRETGCRIYASSKWLNSVIVGVNEDTSLSLLQNLTFVDTIIAVAPKRTNEEKKRSIIENDLLQTSPFSSGSFDESYYGNSFDEIAMINGNFLHNKGFLGEGVKIAILDGGYSNLDSLSCFLKHWTEDRIIAVKDFVQDSLSIFECSNHGTYVASLIGANSPGKYVGTAPEASLFLIRTEDAQTEYIIEEENWIAGVEYADSLGADLIIASLGYTQFDDSTQNHRYEDMVGDKIRISKVSDIAFSKGIVMVNSAGNYRNKIWKYIGAPGDAFNNIVVGGLLPDSTIAAFSSCGPTFDGRVKPDVCVKGAGVSVINPKGQINDFGAGTSFAAPLLAGCTACLMQAFPEATPTEIRQAVLKSADRYFNPDSLYGYGIPNFKKAWMLLNGMEQESSIKNKLLLYPNPFDTTLHIEIFNPEFSKVLIELYDQTGTLHLSQTINDYSYLNSYECSTSHLLPGIYYVKVIMNKKTFIEKVVKVF